MLPLTSSRLLALWEHGAPRHPLDRALLLFAQAAPDIPAEQLADRPLGECNAALMRLRWSSFGIRVALWLDCPACGERMEFELMPDQLPDMQPPPESIEVAGQRFRCPTSRDLARVAHMADMELAAEQLLLGCAGNSEVPGIPREQIEGALESADPWADLSLAFQCPACGRDGEAGFDVASYLWEEVDVSARQLLNEVHLLAQAYGWSEAEILALSPARRSAYLARVAP
jgi:rubredoxin